MALTEVYERVGIEAAKQLAAHTIDKKGRCGMQPRCWPSMKRNIGQ